MKINVKQGLKGLIKGFRGRPARAEEETGGIRMVWRKVERIVQ